jgi:hypothetical protein
VRLTLPFKDMKINKSQIRQMYWDWVQENVEDYRWTTYMNPPDIVDIICDLVEKATSETAE